VLVPPVKFVDEAALSQLVNEAQLDEILRFGFGRPGVGQ
jgi:hypothetical protein